LAQSERPRSALRIYLDILETVHQEGETKPTRILYRANLSHDRLVRYIGELVTKGLLEERQTPDGRSYVLTPAGVSFINELRKAEAFVAGFGINF
jgi:predicted transcriptional regulator